MRERFVRASGVRSALLRPAVALLMLLPAAARGESREVRPVVDAADAAMVLDSLTIAHRLGGSACAGELCARIAAWEAQRPDAGTVNQAAGLMRAIANEADRLDEALPGVRALQWALADWERRARGASGNDLPTAAWQRDGLRLFSGEPGELDAEAILSEICERSPDSCTIAARSLAEVLTLAEMQHRVLDRLLVPMRAMTAERLARSDRRWQAYLAHGPASMPWELALARRSARRAGDVTIFPEPPLVQCVLLHPSASYQFVQPRSNQLGEAVLLEVIGIARWRFGPDDALVPGFGGSLMLAWDGQSSGHVAPGVMIHVTPAISLGVGWRKEDGKDTWPVYASGDLARLLTHRDQLRKVVLDWAMSAGK